MTHCLDLIKNRGYIRIGVSGVVPGKCLWNPETRRMEGFEADLARVMATELYGSEECVELICMQNIIDRITALQEEQVDMVIDQLTITQSRLDKIDFSIPYYEDFDAILVLKDRGIKSIADLDGKTVLVGENCATREFLRSQFSNVHYTTQKVWEWDVIIQKLQKRQVDAVGTGSSGIKSVVTARADADQFALLELPKSLPSKRHAIGVRKNCTDLLNFINQVLQKIQGQGVLHALSKKYAPDVSKLTVYSNKSRLDLIKSRGLIRIGVAGDLPGKAFWNSKTHVMEGFEADLARLIARELFGKEDSIEFVHMHGDERILFLEEDRVDLVIARLSMTPKRLEQIDFSIPYYSDGDAVFTLRGRGIKQIADLKGKRVCVRSGSMTAENFHRYYPEVQLVIRKVREWDEMVQELRAGQLDAIGGTGADLKMVVAHQSDPDQFVLLSMDALLPRQEQAIGVQKGCADLVDFVNKVLAKLQKNGTLDQLYHKYDL
jgi:ABC-type amino acid transport substrate-binding protein